MTDSTPHLRGALVTSAIVLVALLGISLLEGVMVGYAGFAAAILFIAAGEVASRTWGTPQAPLGLSGRRLLMGLAAAGITAAVVFPPFVGLDHLYRNVLGDAPLQLDAWRLVLYPDEVRGFPSGPLSTGHHLGIDGDTVVLRTEGQCDDTLTLAVQGGITHLKRTGPAVDGTFTTPTTNDDGSITLPTASGVGWVVRGKGPVMESVTVQGYGSGCPLLLGRGSVEAPPAPYHAERSWWLYLYFFLWQLIMVAAPEELFFRGYLQTAFNQVWRPRWRWLGGTFGPSLFVTSAIFAVGHVVTEPSVTRLAVFVPSLLFGYLRERTDGLVAPIIVHALSNWLMLSLNLLH